MYVVAMKKKSFDVVEYSSVSKIEEVTVSSQPVLRCTIGTSTQDIPKRTYNVAILFDAQDEVTT